MPTNDRKSKASADSIDVGGNEFQLISELANADPLKFTTAKGARKEE
jgi:hypothetical protein